MQTNFYSFTQFLKQTIFLTITFLWADQALLAQEAPAKLWDKRYGGSEGDYIVKLVQAQDGGFLLGGYSYSGRSGDKSEPSRNLNIAFERDFWLVKTDAQGNKVWDKTLGGNDNDFFTTAIQTADGGYIVGGYVYSRRSGDISTTTHGIPTWWIIKLDANGNKLWDRTIGSIGYDGTKGYNYLNSIIETSDGGLLLGGSSDGYFYNKSTSSKGLKDLWVVKVDGEGTKLWDKIYGGSSEEELSTIIETSDGNFLLGGSSSSGKSGDKSLASRGGWDYWIVKIDPVGNKLWDRSYGGSANEIMTSLLETSDGGFIMGGRSVSGRSGDKTQEANGEGDFWVVRTDAAGNKVWDKAFGGTEDERLNKILQLPDNGFLLAGYSSSGRSGSKTSLSNGSTDCWLVRTDATGNQVWERSIGGKEVDSASDMISTTDGGFLLGGSSFSGPSGQKTQETQGSSDMWIVKLGGEGSSRMSQAPVLTNTVGETSFVEGFDVASTPVAVDAGLTLSDADNATLYSVAVKITAGYTSTQDMLAFAGTPSVTGNITASFSTASGTLHLVSEGASATSEQWQAALRSVTYNNTSDAPVTSPRSITFLASDGDAAGVPSVKVITVTSVNDTPTALQLSKSTVMENVAVGTVVGTFTASDPDANEKFTFALVPGAGDEDNESFEISGNSLKLKISPDFETKNSYTIRAAVTDAAGLKLERSFTITILDADEIPPSGSVSINYGSAYTNSTYVTLSVRIGDASAIRLSNNGTSWSNWYKVYNATTNWSLSAGDGLKTVYMQLRDEAGNISEMFTDDIILDQTKPVPLIASIATSPTAAFPIPVTVRFEEDITGFDVSDISVTGGVLEDFSGTGQHYSFSVMPTVQGEVLINIAAGKVMDIAGNANTAAKPFSVLYAGILRPSLTTTPISNIRHHAAMFGGEITSDGGSPVTERGIIYSTDNDIFTNGKKLKADDGEGSFTLEAENLTPNTTYYVQAYAVNEAGTGYGEELTFVTPHVPGMVTSITSGPSDRNPTNATIVSFRVYFDKGVSGLKASNFALHTTGLTGAAITQVSSSLYPAYHTVTVNTGTGSGTIRLDMTNDKGLNIKIGNLPYISGILYDIDREVPVITGVTHNGQYNTERTITFEGSASISSNRNINWVPFESGGTISEPGSYTLRVTDAAGNQTSVTFHIDKTPPAVYGVQEGGTYNKDVFIVFYEGSGTLNGQPYLSNSAVRNEGQYKLTVEDAAGNTTTVNFGIDKTPPTGSLLINNGADYTNTPVVTLSATATEAASMRVSNTAGQSSPYGGWIEVSESSTWDLVAGDGQKRVYLQLRDAAGNISQEYEAAIILDQTAPSVVVSSGVTHADAAVVALQITFSEEVTGFTIDDITVNGVISKALTGSGKDYLLELEPSLTSPVSVQIAAGVANDLAGNGNTAATPFTLPIVTGIHDLEQQVQLQVYPNPVSRGDLLHVSLNGGRGRSLKLMLYNAKGQLLLERTLPFDSSNAATGTINTSHLPRGLYFLQLSDAEASGVKKILVE